MTCSTCGADNPAEARFCRECGVPLGAVESEASILCPSCRSENPHDAQYCVRCGADMSAAPLPPSPSAIGPVAEAPPQTARLPVRDLGELVGETFRVYGRSFWAFVVIALVALLPSLLVGLIPAEGITLEVVQWSVLIVVQLLTSAAIAIGVISQYLGREVRVGVCYGRTWAKIVSLVNSALVYIVILVLSAVTIVGIPLFFYLLVRWYFFIQTIMIEGKTGPRETLGGSYKLVRGSGWHVFGIGVTYFILLAIASGVAAIPGAIASPISSAMAAVLYTIGQSVVLPIGAIGATLVYLDLRARKEGYSLAQMAGEADL